MTNETTASQPKSIGDDAQFRKMLMDARGDYFDERDFPKFISYIDSFFRAPAAQASATIQEPVMVAEPVGLKLAAYRVTSPNTGKERLMKKSMAKVWDRSGYIVTPLYEVSALAAPMVAEPAGVALPVDLDTFANWIRAKQNAYCESMIHQPDALAATVKAVPSEARIANLEAALRYYAEGNHFMLSDPDAWDTVSGEPFNFQCDEAGTATVEDGSIAKLVLAGEPMPKDDEEITVTATKSEGVFAAPLAEKTGGGE